MTSKFRLRTLLAAAFASLALAMAAAGSCAVERLAGERARLSTGSEMADLAGQIRNLLDRSMYERWREVEVLAAVATTSAPSNEARRSWVEAMKRTYPAYAWIGFADRQGVVRASTGGLLAGASVAARPWFQAGLNAPHASDVHEAALLASKLPPLASGEPLRFVDVSAPVRDTFGQVQGVIGAHLSWTWAGEITKSVLTPALERYAGLEAFVVAADGIVLLGPRPLQGTRLPPDIVATLPKTTDSRHETFSDQVWTDRSVYLVGASRTQGSQDYPGLGWTVLVRQPAEVAYRPVRELSFEILAGGGLLAIAFGFCGWLAAGQIARPLDELTRAAIKARSESVASLETSIGGSAELVSLSASLTSLLSQIDERDRSLAAANADLETRVSMRTSALEEATSLLRLAQEAAGAGTWEWDLKTGAMRLSPESMRLYGFSAHHATTMAITDCTARIAYEDSVALFEVIRKAIKSKQTFATEFRLNGDPGAPEVWILALGRVQYDECDKTPVRIIGLNLDLSQRKKTELALEAAINEAEEARSKAESASQAKTDFLASMSHEIRTPLNGILGFADILLEDGSLTHGQRRRIENIQNAGSALLVVVNDVLDFSKIEARQIELMATPFSLAALVDGSMSIVLGEAQRKGLALSARVDPNLPAWLYGDEARLRQILLNLVNNAVKFTAQGSVEILVACDDSALGMVRFAVSDTGIGIPETKRDRLFQRFSQVDATITREFGGTGLGLAISKSLVGLMDGTIGVESREGSGSTFWFTVALPRSAAPLPSRPAAAARPAPRHNGRILVVEDVAVNQELVRLVLQAADYHVDVVGDGADAIAAVQKTRYDLVLMDVQMPGMDGLTATRHIRALPDAVHAIPIVAMSANVLPFQVAEMTAAGMNGHVGKPFKKDHLYAAIERLLVVEPV